MNSPVYSHQVIAKVRTDGAIGSFERRAFDLMLAYDAPARMNKEAIRILRQIGYETRGVAITPRT